MQSITFDCEIITPMFLSGADGSTPELRPPSIKGALRFWWRAMNGNLSLEELKTKEDEIFGGTDRRSSFSLRVVWIDVDEENIPRFNYHKEMGHRRKSAIAYMNNLSFNQNKKRDAIKPGTKFRCIIQSKDIEKLKIAADAFWLMSILGGLGTRVRRCGGAFRILKFSTKGIKASSLMACYTSNGTLYFSDLKKLSTQVELKSVENSNQVEFSHLSNTTIYYKGGFNDWKTAMEDVGERMRFIRDSFYNKDLEFTQNDLNKKAPFGLPVGVFKSGHANLYVEDNKDKKNELKDARRASPLFITLNKIGTEYYWTVTFLSGRFMPHNSQVQFKNKGPWEEDDIDFELIEDFKNELIEGDDTKIISL
jgi:CRISPR-associated protein Cmr1